MATELDRRSQILEEALLLFAEHGVEGASLRDLAKRVGLTQPSLYHYFSSKEALVEAIFAQKAEQAAQRRTQAMQDAKLDTPQKFCVWLAEEFLRLWQDPNHRALMRFVHGEAMRGGSTARSFTKVHIAPNNAGIAQVFRRFMEEGKLRNVDPEHAARSFVSPIILMMMHQHLMGALQDDPVDLRDFIHSHIDTFLHGISRP
jgi:AcrR family transcriptional regulator